MALVVLVLEFLVGALARDLVVLGDLLVVLERTLVGLVDLTRLGLDDLASLPPGAKLALKLRFALLQIVF